MIDVYWEIAKEQGMSNVTVNAVTIAAGLNRATFYSYFTDLDDLLYQAEEQILEELLQKMRAALTQGLPVDISEATEKVVEVLAQHDEKLFMLLGSNGDPNFITLFRECAANLFGLVFNTEENEAYQEYIIAYVTSAFAGLICYWHESGRKISIEEIASICRNLAIGGLMKMKNDISLI